MLQELRQEFEAYKAETVEKMENERIQLKNAQRAHSQQCNSDRLARPLRTTGSNHNHAAKQVPRA
jgi:hypothetical protein